MGRVVDILEHSLESIVGDGTLVLKRYFTMGGFNFFQDCIPPFKEYWVHIFEHKKMQRISDSGSKSVPFAMLQDELFSPSNLTNKKIYSIVEKISVTAAKLHRFIKCIRSDPSAHKWIYVSYF